MKIKEYNQMIKHLTRKKPEVDKSKKENLSELIEASNTIKPLLI